MMDTDLRSVEGLSLQKTSYRCRSTKTLGGGVDTFLETLHTGSRNTFPTGSLVASEVKRTRANLRRVPVAGGWLVIAPFNAFLHALMPTFQYLILKLAQTVVTWHGPLIFCPLTELNNTIEAITVA